MNALPDFSFDLHLKFKVRSEKEFLSLLFLEHSMIDESFFSFAPSTQQVILFGDEFVHVQSSCLLTKDMKVKEIDDSVIDESFFLKTS
jgi:hypothetical protein